MKEIQKRKQTKKQNRKKNKNRTIKRKEISHNWIRQREKTNKQTNKFQRIMVFKRHPLFTDFFVSFFLHLFVYSNNLPFVLARIGDRFSSFPTLFLSRHQTNCTSFSLLCDFYWHKQQQQHDHHRRHKHYFCHSWSLGFVRRKDQPSYKMQDLKANGVVIGIGVKE